MDGWAAFRKIFGKYGRKYGVNFKRLKMCAKNGKLQQQWQSELLVLKKLNISKHFI